MKNKQTILHKIGGQMILLILLAIVLPSVVFFIVIANRYSSELLDRAIKERTGLLQEINKSISLQLTDYQELSMTVYYDTATKAYIDSGDYTEPSEAVKRTISALLNSKPYIESVNLCFGRQVYSYGREFFNIEEYRNQYEELVIEEEGRCVWLPTECMLGSFTRTPKDFALARALNSPDGTIGVMYMYCSSSFFDKVMNNPILTEDGSHYYLLGQNGQVVASDQENYVGTNTDLGFTPEDCSEKQGFFTITGEDGEKWIVTYAKMEDIGWTNVIVSTYKSIYRSVYSLLRMIGAFFLFYLLAVVTGYTAIHILVIRPLEQLSNGMENVSRGAFIEAKLPLVKNEIAQLTESFNDMIAHIQMLLHQVRIEEEEKNRQRMKVLYMQIGPHFLYNTLNSIKWMAVLNNQVGIKMMVESLMKLMAGVTYNKKDDISIREELGLLDSYIHIQKVRFVNFSVHYDIPREVMDLRIGRFMLQPFVENSILHGLRGTPYEGIIQIRARCSDALYIEIEDNGRGFDQTVQPLVESALGDQDHIGIENVRERIHLHHGDDYGVEVKSEIGHGTTVYLRLPIIKEGEEGQ